VYWDLRSRIATTRSGRAPAALAYAGDFDRTIPVLGTPNESVLKRAVGPQIAPLYGTRCRSIPVFFMRDDHDYFRHDEADDRLVTFPPDAFMFRAARAHAVPLLPGIPSRGEPPARPCPAPARPIALQAPRKASGTLRYGKLAEFLMYDCRGYITLAGKSAGFVPLDVETWLARRVAADDTGPPHQRSLHADRLSAGKWGEWYADVERNARLTTDSDETLLATRLARAARPARQGRLGDEGAHALFLSGDLHAIGEGIMRRTNDFRSLHAIRSFSILTGPLGTGARAGPPRPRHAPADSRWPGV